MRQSSPLFGRPFVHIWLIPPMPSLQLRKSYFLLISITGYSSVTQMLRLLNLAPEVLKVIAALGDPLPSPIVTERRLRPIVNLPAEEQKQKSKTLLGGKHLI